MTRCSGAAVPWHALPQKAIPSRYSSSGEGITSRFASRADASARDMRELSGHSRAAATALGITDVVCAGLPDNRFDSIDLLDIVKTIEQHLEAREPEIVFTQHGGDLNIDHVLTYRASMIAARPLPNARVRSLIAYSVASSSEWAFDRFAPAYHPNLFVDIGNFLENKLVAMAAYEGELREFPHPRSLTALRAEAVRLGATAGVQAAEAFEVVYHVERQSNGKALF